MASYHERPIIGITGSSGKTTVKEMVASILQRKWKTFRSKENLNTPRYTAINKRKLNNTHHAIVLEYGMLRAGQIRKHCQLIQPNIGIITNVNKAHIGTFGKEGVKGIAKAKSELIHGMRPDGLLFLNADCKNLKLLQKEGFKGSIITVGVLNQADYKAHQIRYTDQGMQFQVHLNGKNQTFFIPVFGEHNVYNALFAIALSHKLGFTVEDMKIGLKTYYRPEGRLTTVHLKEEILLINDTFNTKPCAYKAAIDVLTQINRGTSIAVLGAIKFLGIYSEAEHKNVGRYIAARNVDLLFTIGVEGKYIGEGAIKAGFPPERVLHFTSKKRLLQALMTKMKPKTTILVKGVIKKGKRVFSMTDIVSYIRKVTG